MFSGSEGMRANTRALHRVAPVVALGIGAALVASGQTRTIQGTVTDPQGKPLAGVMVSAVLKATASGFPPTVSVPIAQPPNGSPTKPAPAGLLPFRSKAPSGGNGGFEIDNVLAGSYSLCASKPDSDLLDPCFWADGASTVTAPSAGVSLVVGHGVTIGLRVDDAKGLTAVRPATDDILIGTVHGSSAFIPARVLERDGTGKTLGLTVPPAAALNLVVHSKNFSLNDDKGAALTTGAAIPLTAPAVAPAIGPNGLPAAILTVHIAGVVAVQ